MKKEWIKPEFLRLDVGNTQGGGCIPIDHDGLFFQISNSAVNAESTS